MINTHFLIILIGKYFDFKLLNKTGLSLRSTSVAHALLYSTNDIFLVILYTHGPHRTNICE